MEFLIQIRQHVNFETALWSTYDNQVRPIHDSNLQCHHSAATPRYIVRSHSETGGEGSLVGWGGKAGVVSTQRGRWKHYAHIHTHTAAREVVIVSYYNEVIMSGDGVSNHQPHDCLPNGLIGHRSKKTSKLRITGLCEGNSLVTGEFPTQRASNAENVSIWWHYHGDVTWLSQHLKSPVTQMFVQQFVQANIKGSIEDPHHWLFVKGIHRSLVVPLTKGQ